MCRVSEGARVERRIDATSVSDWLRLVYVGISWELGEASIVSWLGMPGAESLMEKGFSEGKQTSSYGEYSLDCLFLLFFMISASGSGLWAKFLVSARNLWGNLPLYEWISWTEFLYWFLSNFWPSKTSVELIIEEVLLAGRARCEMVLV